MNYERDAKKIADKLLEDVGLEPQSEEGDLIEMMQEDSNDFVERRDGVTYMKFDTRRMVGVPSGTLLPVTCNVLHQDPWESEPSWHSFGPVLIGPVSMVQSDGKRRFWVEVPGPRTGQKYKVQALPEHIELTHIPVDWGSIKRVRLP